MKKLLVLVSFLFLLFHAHSQVPTEPQDFVKKDFRAEFDIVSELEGLVINTSLHIFASREAMRTDIFMAGKRITYSIVRYEEGELVSYGILPDTKHIMVVRGGDLQELMGAQYSAIGDSNSDMASNCSAQVSCAKK